MTFLTVGWGPVIDAGLLPQHPGDGDTPILTCGWVARRGTTYYPYDAAGFAATQIPPPAVAPPATLGESAMAVALPVAGLAVAAAVLAKRRRATPAGEAAGEAAPVA